MVSKVDFEKENKDLTKEVEKLDNENRKLNLKLAQEKAKKGVSEFRDEFNKTLATALVAAFGLVIGLSWNELIKAYFSSLNYLETIHSNLLQTLLVTLIGVIAIMIVTKILRKKKN